MERPLTVRLKSALADIVTSKKFIMGVSTAAAAYGLKYGLDIDPEIVALILSPVLLAILGQSAADFGKEAEKVAARLGKPSEMTQTVTVEAAPTPDNKEGKLT